MVGDDGVADTVDAAAARAVLEAGGIYICYAPYIAKRLGVERYAPCLDVLELFAFVHPATFAVPSPEGMCRTLGLLEPETGEDAASALYGISRQLLRDLQAGRLAERSDAAGIAWMMGHRHVPLQSRQGWIWADSVLAALGTDPETMSAERARHALDVWRSLPEWEETRERAPVSHTPVSPDDARHALNTLLSSRNRNARPAQADYAAELTPAFAPAVNPGAPHVAVAEAGTGTGKTLGYLAAAGVWARENKAAVWISTYTRNLQRQIASELAATAGGTNPAGACKTVVRKGRENYLCLLNLDEDIAAARLQPTPLHMTSLGLMARYTAATKDGDMTGGDMPGWMVGLLGIARTRGLSDKKGECIYAACPHYKKCFVERSVQNARDADIVIANHALVMHQASVNGGQSPLPQRYIFDEGHHVFDAADSTYACHLSGLEMADMRRWILGADAGAARSRLRGLKRRLEDIIAGDPAASDQLTRALDAARILPGHGWLKRISEDAPKGPAEDFLRAIKNQSLARAAEKDGTYGIETPPHPLNDDVRETARVLRGCVEDILIPLSRLKAWLENRIEDAGALMDADDRRRTESVINALDQKTRHALAGWRDMLDQLETQTPQGFCDWFEIARIEGRDFDVGYKRHWIDPMQPFAATMRTVAHGMVMTSASLRDASETDPEGWQAADIRTGAPHLKAEGGSMTKLSVTSPFNYPDKARILVVGGVPKNNPARIAAAYHDLFTAAGGGGLGLFTSIRQLRHVHEHMSPKMARAGMRLYAQHIDDMDTSTLIDLFRLEKNACLLGTDATRDGIDVPGDSLRLIVYDRVPWPRPTLLHRARRSVFGKTFDDMMTRYRLKQAFGRLIRSADDRGVFVILDNMLPTRLTSAFPPGVEIVRTDLSDACRIVSEFFNETDKNKTRKAG